MDACRFEIVLSSHHELLTRPAVKAGKPDTDKVEQKTQQDASLTVNGPGVKELLREPTTSCRTAPPTTALESSDDIHAFC